MRRARSACSRAIRVSPRLYHDSQWFFFGEMQLTPLMKQVQLGAGARALEVAGPPAPAGARIPALRAKLVPDYPIGAKRVLFNDDYYPALAAANVELVTDGIERDPARRRAHAGRQHCIPADVIVYATGFKSTEFLAPMHDHGRGGRDLQRRMEQGCAGIPRRHGERLPELLHAVRPQHQPRVTTASW